MIEPRTSQSTPGLHGSARGSWATRQASEPTREGAFVRMLQIATAAGNEARSLREAVHLALEGVSAVLQCQLARAVIVHPDADPELLVGVPERHQREFVSLPDPTLIRAVREEVVRIGCPRWIPDASGWSGSREGSRDPAVRGFATPVRVGEGVAAALEFVWQRPHCPDEGLLEVAAVVGLLLGRAVERARLDRALRALRDLPQRLLDERERERTRIAGDLHDVLLQSVAAVQLQSDNLASALSVNRHRQAEDLAVAIKDQVGTLVCQVRRAVADLLRPDLDDDLVTALSRYGRAFEAETGIEVDLGVAPDAQEALPRPLTVLLHECCQEALTNVARHAGAGRVEIRLARVGGMVELRVCDDGCGPSLAHRDRDRLGYGLTLTRNKVALMGGGVWLEPRADRGAELIVRVPVRTTPCQRGAPEAAAGGSQCEVLVPAVSRL